MEINQKELADQQNWETVQLCTSCKHKVDELADGGVAVVTERKSESTEGPHYHTTFYKEEDHPYK